MREREKERDTHTDERGGKRKGLGQKREETRVREIQKGKTREECREYREIQKNIEKCSDS